jgi:hypothetical protein
MGRRAGRSEVAIAGAMTGTTPEAGTARSRFARLCAELNANLGAYPTCALTNQANRRPEGRRASAAEGRPVERVVRGPPTQHDEPTKTIS